MSYDINMDMQFANPPQHIVDMFEKDSLSDAILEVSNIDMDSVLTFYNVPLFADNNGTDKLFSGFYLYTFSEDAIGDWIECPNRTRMIWNITLNNPWTGPTIFDKVPTPLVPRGMKNPLTGAGQNISLAVLNPPQLSIGPAGFPSIAETVKGQMNKVLRSQVKVYLNTVLTNIPTNGDVSAIIGLLYYTGNLKESKKQMR